MTDQEREAIVAIAVLAAYADGSKDAAERGEVKDLAASLEVDGAGRVVREVLLGRADVASVAAELTDERARALAYESAICVCEADGVTTDAEKSFLADLARRLEIESGSAAERVATADAFALAPLDEPAHDLDDRRVDFGLATAGASGATVGAAGVATASPAETTDPRDAEIDKSILTYAILTAAIELLPQELATAAIIPLQMKMVYGVGKRYGYDLDRGHVKDFLMTAGAGLTGQMLEGVARKFIGSLAKKALGKTAGGLLKKGTGPAMTFATTWALGRVAQRYYAGGRTMSADVVREAFRGETQRAQALYAQHEGAIRERSATLSPSQVLGLVRG